MVDQMPMFLPKAPGSYSTISRNSNTLVNSCEVVVHATKSVKDYKTAESMVNYRVRMPTVRNRYAGWTNVLVNGGALGSGERFYIEDSQNSRKTKARPEQK